jgi:hypothetical protein
MTTSSDNTAFIQSTSLMIIWPHDHHQFFFFCCDATRVMASSFLRFPDHTQRRTTVGRTPLDKRSARRRDLYLTTHTTHNRQTSMPPVGFEPTISAGERPQTYALDRAANGTGNIILTAKNIVTLTINIDRVKHSWEI